MATSKPRCLKSRPESAFWSVALSSLAAMRQMSQKAMLQAYLYSYNTFNYRTIQNHADVTRCWREEDTKAAHEQPRRDIGVYEQRVRGSARRPNRKRRIEKPAQTPTLNQRYDIIGDIHGHADELVALLRTLGYARKGVPFGIRTGARRSFWAISSTEGQRSARCWERYARWSKPAAPWPSLETTKSMRCGSTHSAATALLFVRV
jgi:hypothetical protein